MQGPPPPYSSKRLAMPFFGLEIVLLFCIALLATSCHEQEKSSLLRFLAGLSHENAVALSWQDGTECCEWEGITCDQSGAVIEVSLPSRNLKGSISPSLGELTSLLRINLSDNSLRSGLPSALLSSSSITILDVSFNRLSGDLQEPLMPIQGHPLQALNISSNLFTGELTSTTWEKMRNLVTINASNNSFQGLIPSSFCISSLSFAVLDLSYNRFNGNIPANLGKCSALKVLKAGHNNLSGPLPDELFHATSIECLSFPKNGLRGVLDGAQIVNLRNLVNLDLGGNRLHGKVPESICQLKRLQEIHLNDNNMSGELPSSLSNCTNITTIQLKSNNFSGELQKINFSNLPYLKTLDLLYNNFTGTIPESMYSCSNLIAVRLSGNNLHGQISPRIGNLKSLVFLSIASNKFTNITYTLQILKNSTNLTFLFMGTNFKGEVMPQVETIDGFQNLRVLSLADCSLSGQIPRWLSKLKNLEMLFLQSNQISGTFPAWIKSLESLFYLDISNNRLTGEIPEALMAMPLLTATHLDPWLFDITVYLGTSLQYRLSAALPNVLNLGNNLLTGIIPKDIGQLKSLTTLNVSFNKLSGEIPQQLCNLTNLQQLDLSSNNLIGTIPFGLSNLHFLSAFNISNNNLEGPIPTGGQFSTFLNSSFEGNPKLCGAEVNRPCGSTEAPPVSTLSTKLTEGRIPFLIAFCTFFGVGVLYDQLVMTRFFG